jgi:hypothetical protein
MRMTQKRMARGRKVDPVGNQNALLAEMGLRDHEARILEFTVRHKRPLFRGSIRSATRDVTFFKCRWSWQ